MQCNAASLGRAAAAKAWLATVTVPSSSPREWLSPSTRPLEHGATDQDVPPWHDFASGGSTSEFWTRWGRRRATLLDVPSEGVKRPRLTVRSGWEEAWMRGMEAG